MSKFSERLSSLGQSGPARMGFGQSSARERKPVMLVIARGGDPQRDAASADLFLRDGAAGAKGDNWGLAADGNSKVDLDTLEKNGCQFLLINSEDASAELLLTEELGMGVPVEDGLPEQRIRAIEDAPFDFLVYRPDLSWPLTVGAVMKLQELVSSYSKHIFLDLTCMKDLPGKKDLEVLKNLPVSALLLDLDEVKPADAAKLKEAISTLEPRKPSHRSDRSPLVPMAGRNGADEADSGDNDYEDDEDEWED